jgi:hypothetical protein
MSSVTGSPGLAVVETVESITRGDARFGASTRIEVNLEAVLLAQVRSG